MEKLINGHLGPDESWQEYADHSLDHDNYFEPSHTDVEVWHEAPEE